MNDRRVQIVVDDTACLNFADSIDYDITVLPMQVDTDGDDVTTSAIQTLDLAVAYARAQERSGDKGVLALHVSKTFSSTWSNGVIAGEAVGNIEVVDTGTVGAAVGRAAVEAARVAEDGGSLRECRDAARKIIDRSHVWGYVPRLDTMRRGGRISTGKVVLSTALAIKPLIGVEDGSINLVAKHRTVTKVLDALIERCTAVAAGFPADCIIMNSGDTDLVEVVQEHLEDHMPGGTTIEFTDLPPSLLAHTGPEACFVAVIPDPEALLHDVHPDTPASSTGLIDNKSRPGTPDGGLVYSTAAGGVVVGAGSDSAGRGGGSTHEVDSVGVDPGSDGTANAADAPDTGEPAATTDGGDKKDGDKLEKSEKEDGGDVLAIGTEWVRAVSAQIMTRSENRRLAKEKAETPAPALVDDGVAADADGDAGGDDDRSGDGERKQHQGLLKGFLRRLGQENPEDSSDPADTPGASGAGGNSGSSGPSGLSEPDGSETDAVGSESAEPEEPADDGTGK